MYTSHFGLLEKPFAISPDPRYLYMSEPHREALAHLLYGLETDGCFILLTGDVGTGKTTVCRCLLEQVPKNMQVALILNPNLSALELLQTICEELEIVPRAAKSSIKAYTDHLQDYFLQSHARGQTTILIIDEAQNLTIGVLEQLRLLTNLETNSKKLLRVLLIGQPELCDILKAKELTQLNQRITSRYHLGPLQAEDVPSYITHRLGIAGQNDTTLFSDKAIAHAINLTGGVPRLINVLCDRALLGAYAENTTQVSLEIIKKAGQEVFPQLKRVRLLRGWDYLFAAVLLTLVISIPAAYFFSRSTGSDTETVVQAELPAATEVVEVVSQQPDSTGTTIRIAPPIEVANKSEFFSLSGETSAENR